MSKLIILTIRRFITQSSMWITLNLFIYVIAFVFGPLLWQNYI